VHPELELELGVHSVSFQGGLPYLGLDGAVRWALGSRLALGPAFGLREDLSRTVYCVTAGTRTTCPSGTTALVGALIWLGISASFELIRPAG
jgi:hypothetical protein